MKRSAQEDAFLHRDGTSFHLSHQPHLYVSSRDLVIRMGLFTLWVSAISTLLLHKLIIPKSDETYRVGWWLKWKLIPCRWRNTPSRADLFTFADYFPKLRCDLLKRWDKKCLKKKSHYVWRNLYMNPLSTCKKVWFALQDRNQVQWGLHTWTETGLNPTWVYHSMEEFFWERLHDMGLLI